MSDLLTGQPSVRTGLLGWAPDMTHNVGAAGTFADPTAAGLVQLWQSLDIESCDRDSSAGAGEALRRLIAADALDLPLPASGRTADRFRILSRLAELDLTVARLGEAHTDAIAILAELDGPRPGRADVWGVWAAEPPQAPVRATQSDVTTSSDSDASWRLDGRKAWCSGAGICTRALITAAGPDGSQLFAVDLAAPGISPVDDAWPVATLRGADTRSVDFSEAPAVSVGVPGAYVDRPGFWHGAAGVAAVWYGGAVGVARALQRAHDRRPLDELGLMHLGAVDAALAGAAAALAAAAAAFDADPRDATGRAAAVARRTRAVVEAAATETIDRVGRALGAAPLALDARHAHRVADLQLYLRQSHADRDLASLGRLVADTGDDW